MTFMPWTSELEVGIADLDSQHRWLVEQTNALHEAIGNGSDHAQLGQLLEALMDYVMNHFVREEALFVRLGYPEAEAHQAQHNRFSGQVMALLSRHDCGEAVGYEALELLKDWLTHHILSVDKAYVDHFRALGYP